jgi:hypothetical protein
MSRARYTPEQIVGKLREAEVALAQGGGRRLRFAVPWGQVIGSEPVKVVEKKKSFFPL